MRNTEIYEQIEYDKTIEMLEKLVFDGGVKAVVVAELISLLRSEEKYKAREINKSTRDENLARFILNQRETSNRVLEMVANTDEIPF